MQAHEFRPNALLNASQVAFQRLSGSHQRRPAQLQPLGPWQSDGEVAQHNDIPVLLALVRRPRLRSQGRWQHGIDDVHHGFVVVK